MASSTTKDASDNDPDNLQTPASLVPPAFSDGHSSGALAAVTSRSSGVETEPPASGQEHGNSTSEQSAEVATEGLTLHPPDANIGLDVSS